MEFMASRQNIVTLANNQQPLPDIQKLLDYSLDVICAISEDGIFWHVTAAAEQVWGYSPAEMVGRHYLDFVIPEDRPATEAIAEAIFAGKTIRSFENRYRKKCGTVVPMLWSAKWDEQSRTVYCVAKDATERYEAEQKTRLYEQRLYKAYKLGKIGWWEWNGATNENILSDELYAIYGFKRENCPVFSTDIYLSMVHPEDLPSVLAAINLSKQQPNSQYEHRLIKPSGEVITVNHYVESIWDESGKLVQIHGITKDISIRKNAETALRQSELKLTTILESIGDSFFTVDRNWIITYFNRKAEEVLQVKREDVLGKSLWEVFKEAIHLNFYPEFHKASNENTAVHFEECYPPLSMWLQVSAYPSAEGLSVYFKNITESRKQKEALEESYIRYQLATKATSDAIWDWDPHTNSLYWGEGIETIFGYKEHEAASDINSWKEHIHPDDLERVWNGLSQFVSSNGKNWQDEYRYRRADGSYAVVADRGFVVRDEEGKVIRMAGAIQDITTQKESADAIKHSEERFRLLFYHSPKPKWIFKENTLQIVEANEAALKLYGYSKTEFLQLTILDLKLPEDIAEVHALQTKGVDKFHSIVRHKKKNGEVFTLDLATHVIELPNGRHFIVIGEDLTETLKLQQMVMDEKISAQKEVAKAIIHTQEKERSEIAKELHDNINQLLTTAKLYVENIHYFPDQQEVFVQKGISLLQKSIQEIRVLSKQLVTPVFNDIGFKATLDELLAHYLSLNIFCIELLYEVDENTIDKGLQLTIYRIIQEQLNNIVKYARASQAKVFVVEIDNVLHILISDDGVGFDKERVTKGLGLANMKNRAEVYRGEIVIDSKIGQGTTVSVKFPHLTNSIA